ncbi:MULTISPECIES: hypothetical protein [unclassified Bacillus (in: firmicutes)]|nr:MULTISPECIES: hypothetical protein [unclassified Bacillus (in: firmicutes)]
MAAVGGKGADFWNHREYYFIKSRREVEVNNYQKNQKLLLFLIKL